MADKRVNLLPSKEGTQKEPQYEKPAPLSVICRAAVAPIFARIVTFL